MQYVEWNDVRKTESRQDREQNVKTDKIIQSENFVTFPELLEKM